MPVLELQLNISADELLALYRGEVRAVRARALTGQTVQFPAAALRRHVSPLGVHGRFRMEFDAQHKFVSLERMTA
jgi:hypothetical protein